ncbi:MAG: AAA family ATPase [Granulosicoccus sp.]
MSTDNWKGLQAELAQRGYIASDALAMAVYLSGMLQRPLLLEGAAGVGKTEVAKKLAELNGCQLIRLQCYQGLDASSAIYEWNYQRQLLSLRATDSNQAQSLAEKEEQIFSDTYLLKRPLLQSISQNVSPVLLIDEVDRADEEFEAYLLELLSDFQVSIPELGTIKATTIPQVVLTSNGSRDLSDALRRRSLYNFVDYPDFATETAILKARMPELDDALASQIVGFVQALRKEDLEKNPGVAEMLDWAAAISGLGMASLSDDSLALQASLVCLLKTEEDAARVPVQKVQQIAGALVE